MFTTVLCKTYFEYFINFDRVWARRRTLRAQFCRVWCQFAPKLANVFPCKQCPQFHRRAVAKRAIFFPIFPAREAVGVFRSWELEWLDEVQFVGMGRMRPGRCVDRLWGRR